MNKQDYDNWKLSYPDSWDNDQEVEPETKKLIEIDGEWYRDFN